MGIRLACRPTNASAIRRVPKPFAAHNRLIKQMSSLKGKPRRSVLIAARLITALVSLAGAEGVLWLGGYPSWWAVKSYTRGGSEGYEGDPNLGWKAQQGDIWLVANDPSHPFRVTNWSDGRRATSEQEPEHGAASRPKMLFFGDSYVQGYGLTNADTLPWIVQKRHPELDVSNFGAGNYGTYQSYLAMRQRVHRPADVYYEFSGFHEGRNAGEPSFLRIMTKPPEGWFFPYAQMSDGKLEGRRSPGELVWPLSRYLRTVAMIEEYKQLIESYRRRQDKRKITEALLVKMNETVRAAGGTFTVIVFDLDPQERKDYRSFLETQKISFIDCDRPELNDRTLRLPDGHPNGKLNELLAKWIEPIPVVPSRVVSVNQPAPRGITQ
jgi:hypothetical protein